MAWSGEDRRKKDNGSHDLLIRIDANLSNHLEAFRAHADSDKEHFDRLYLQTSGLKKFMNRAIGAIVILMAIPTIVFILKTLGHSS